MKDRKKNKTKRLKCEFNECECTLYIGKKDGRCECCKHGDVWHKLGSPQTYFNKDINMFKFEDNLTDCPH